MAKGSLAGVAKVYGSHKVIHSALGAVHLFGDGGRRLRPAAADGLFDRRRGARPVASSFAGAGIRTDESRFAKDEDIGEARLPDVHLSFVPSG